MHQIQEIKQKYFVDCKKIISDLYDCEFAEDLIDNKYLIDKLLENVSFLKLIEEHSEIFNTEKIVEEGNQKDLPLNVSETGDNTSNVIDEHQSLDFTINEENESAEELPSEILNETQEEEIIEESEIANTEETHSFELDEEIQENDLEDKIEEEPNISEQIVEKQKEFTDETEEILNENPSEVTSENQEPISDFSENELKQDKKFKLANIKGLKTIESLFDDEYLELSQPESPKEEPVNSITETHVSQQKSNKEFRLDLNDKIAFSKMLFGGSQMEMNDVISNLNHCQTLDEAKEYLSDLYYAKKWDRVDDYAQRLWTLVENKFI